MSKDKIILTGYHTTLGKRFDHMFRYSYNILKRDQQQGGQILDRDIQAVIHLAESTDYRGDPDHIIKWNTEYTNDLYNSCVEAGIPFIFASTGDLKENPKNNYEWSKYLSERHILKSPRRIPVQILRFCDVYDASEYGSHEFRTSQIHLLKMQAHVIKQIKIIKEIADIERDYICAEDACQIIRKFIGYPNSGVFEVGTGQSYSFRTIANVLAKHLGVPVVDRKVLLEDLKERSCFLRNLTADTSTLYNAIGPFEFGNVLDFIKKGKLE